MSEQYILPRTFSSQTVTSHYAAVSWFYDLWAFLTEDKAVKQALRLSGIHDEMDVLEVAVGTGRLFKKIVELNPHGRNEGVDISQDMLSRAQKRLAGNTKANWNLQIGTAFDLPFEDRSFDLIFNTFMLDLFPEEDFPKVIREFQRVLRPDGKLVLVTFGFGQFWFNRFWFWLAKTFPALLTNCRPVHVNHVIESFGLRIVQSKPVSQNTFPSDITIVVKE